MSTIEKLDTQKTGDGHSNSNQRIGNTLNCSGSNWPKRVNAVRKSGIMGCLKIIILKLSSDYYVTTVWYPVLGNAV